MRTKLINENSSDCCRIIERKRRKNAREHEGKKTCRSVKCEGLKKTGTAIQMQD